MSVRNRQGQIANMATRTPTATVSHRGVGKRSQVPTQRNAAKVPVQGVVTLRAYTILTEALDGALAAGVHKLFKYVDSKDGRVDEDYVIAHLDTISNYLDIALCEVLDFGDD